jgi:formate hydrogenlyase subunit 3/multisubunit Na+/H+ antiporter MnhD subunit
MFLVIGGIIYYCNGSQDIRWVGGLMLYSPFLWVSYLIGGVSLIGLPYFSGYLYKFFLINSLVNNFIYIKGGEFFLLLSYFFTIFYVFRLGYLVFLTNKNGHKNIYKIKKISIFYIISLFTLCLVIMFFHYFWVNLIFINLKNISNSYFFNIYQSYTYQNLEITYLSAYLWFLIYFFIFFFLFFFNVLSLNLNWNFFKNWYFLNNIFLIFFIYYIF